MGSKGPSTWVIWCCLPRCNNRKPNQNWSLLCGMLRLQMAALPATSQYQPDTWAFDTYLRHLNWVLGVCLSPGVNQEVIALFLSLSLLPLALNPIDCCLSLSTFFLKNENKLKSNFKLFTAWRKGNKEWGGRTDCLGFRVWFCGPCTQWAF